jgi:hypothetical protein
LAKNCGHRLQGLDGLCLAIALCLGSVAPAEAQLEALSPAFNRLAGAMVWGSIGYHDPGQPDRIRVSGGRPSNRLGFAALYGPFGSEPDTTVTLDSTVTQVSLVPPPGSSGADGAADTVRTVRHMQARSVRSGRGGWVSLAFGYQYSGSYSVDLSGSGGTLRSTPPVAGPFCGAFFGPFRVGRRGGPLSWSGAISAMLVRLDDATGRSGSTGVRYSTETTLAPEAHLVLALRVHPGVRCLAGLSYQEVKWVAIRYRSAIEAEPLPASEEQQLPTRLKFKTVHLTLGFTFTGRDLLRKSE